MKDAEIFQQLQATQRSLSAQIINWFETFKKSDVQQRQAIADDYEANSTASFNTFQEDHKTILSLKSVNTYANRTYFAKNVFATTKEKYDELKALISKARADRDAKVMDPTKDNSEGNKKDDQVKKPEDEENTVPSTDDDSEESEFDEEKAPKKRKSSKKSSKHHLSEIKAMRHQIATMMITQKMIFDKLQLAETSRKQNKNENASGNDSNLKTLARLMTKSKIEFPVFKPNSYFEWRCEVDAFETEDNNASSNNVKVLYLKQACPNEPIVQSALGSRTFEDVMAELDARYLILRNIAGAKIETMIECPKSDGSSESLMKLHDTFKIELKNLECLIEKHGQHDWSADDEVTRKLKFQAEIGKIFQATLLSSKLDDETRNSIMPKIAPNASDIPDCDKILEFVNTKFINTAQQSQQ